MNVNQELLYKKQIEDDARLLSDFMMIVLLSKLDMIKDVGEVSS